MRFDTSVYDEAWAEDVTRDKMYGIQPYSLRTVITSRQVAGRAPRGSRTCLVGLSISGSSSSGAFAHMKLYGTRHGMPYVRYFTLGDEQTVEIDVTHLSDATLYLMASDIVDATGGSQLVVAWSPAPRAANVPNRAFYAATYDNSAGAAAKLYDVPPAAVKAALGAAVSSLRWLVKTSAGTAVYVTGSGVPNVYQDVGGLQFEVPAGETANILWEVAL